MMVRLPLTLVSASRLEKEHVKNGQLSAVIDFGLMRIGDLASDLMANWTMLSSKTREIFRSTLHVDDATWIRARGWALYFGLLAFLTI